MNRRVWRVAGVFAGAALAGCTTTVVGRVDPALFGAAENPAARSTGDVVLAMRPADAAIDQGCELPSDVGPADFHLKVGALVEAAARRAFGQEFAAVHDASGAGATKAPWTLRIGITEIRFDCRNDLVYVVPLGPLIFDRRDISARLTVQVRVLDGDGGLRWSRSYDSGRAFWQPRPAPALLTRGERAVDGVQRIAHEQAWRLLGQAARDVRAWAEAERARERVL